MERQQHAFDEGVDMSIVRKIKNRSTDGTRALARAVAKAPTRSSREELLLLQNMGR
ncbi:MAG: hypothetical protein JWN08_3031 [Frankiales bacterium]|jgi:hypothetical protein|nr:hypothetical protein [Frankiales bacterium]